MNIKALSIILAYILTIQLVLCEHQHQHQHQHQQQSEPQQQHYSASFSDHNIFPSQHTTTTAPNTTMSKSSDLLKLLANRRSYYRLTSSSPLPDSAIREIFSQLLLTIPSSFNTQSTRIVLALGPAHQQVWDTVRSTMESKLGSEKYHEKKTDERLLGFRAAYGTALFYDDPTDVAVMKEKFPTYKDQFDPWSDHSNGMHQLAAWTALEAEGYGANLQHYNPVPDEELAKIFEVPSTWKLKAQLVFGGIEGGRPDSKPKKDLSETLKVFGAKEGE